MTNTEIAIFVTVSHAFLHFLPIEAETKAINFVTEQGRDCNSMNSGPDVKMIQILSMSMLAVTHSQLSNQGALFHEGQLGSAICLLCWVVWPEFVSQSLLSLSGALQVEIQEDSGQGNSSIQEISK